MNKTVGCDVVDNIYVSVYTKKRNVRSKKKNRWKIFFLFLKCRNRIVVLEQKYALFYSVASVVCDIISGYKCLIFFNFMFGYLSENNNKISCISISIHVSIRNET